MRSRESVSKVATGTSRGVDPESWVDDHGDCLYRYALLRVRRPEVAEDLVQETLYAAVRSYGNFQGKSSERTWLCGILKNKICDYFRKLGRETNFTDLEFLNDVAQVHRSGLDPRSGSSRMGVGNRGSDGSSR